MLVGVVIGALGLFADYAPATPEPPAHKVTLCHATDSYTTPYRVITVDVASLWFEGHNDHDGPVFSQTLPKHEKWGDIIPPFHYAAGYYDGKNWDRAGRTVFDDGCGVPKLHCGASGWCPSTSTSTSSTNSTSTSTTCPKSTSSSSSTSSSTSTTSTTITITTLGSTVPPTTGPPPTQTTATTIVNVAPRPPLPFTGDHSSALVVVGVSLFGSGLGLSMRRRARR